MNKAREVVPVEKSKKASMILWDKNPFDNAKNFYGKITIIKDGKMVNNLK